MKTLLLMIEIEDSQEEWYKETLLESMKNPNNETVFGIRESQIKGYQIYNPFKNMKIKGE